MRRRTWAAVCCLAALLGLSPFAWKYAVGAAKPIRVGLLHSITGPMAISEASMVDAEKWAVDEINLSGGLLGRRVEVVTADGRSDPVTFAREAERLIRDEHVSVIFGCWSSACRKTVKTVVEREDHLLVYPVAYEGLEQSPNIVYTGAAPNQQIIPTVKWCGDTLNAKSFFLIGTDSIWPHAANTIIKDELTSFGAKLAGEVYVPLGASDLDAVVEKVFKAKPDVVLSTIEGASNLPFYRKARGAGGDALKTPIVSFVVAEDELTQLPAKDMVNDYSVCNYFQSLDLPENERLVKAFKHRFGQDRALSDSVVTAYNSVKLWAQAAVEVETDEVGPVRTALLHQSLNAAEGVISVDRETQHTWRPFYVGRVQGDGRIEVLRSLTKPIRPVPFPYSRSRREWNEFLEDLNQRWDGGWTPPPTTRKPV